MSDRDRGIERLLRTRADHVEPGDESACLSSDTVAAWVDGTLASEAREIAEVHAADCSRCQAVLAAVMLTEPEPEPARSAWGAPLRWLVPLAAGATALALWVAIPEQRIGPESDQLMASKEETIAPTPTETSPAAAAAPSAPASSANESAVAAERALGEVRERAGTEQTADEPASPGLGGVSSGVAQGRVEETLAVPDVARRSQAQISQEPESPGVGAELPKADEAPADTRLLRSAAELTVGQRAFADRLDRVEVLSADESVRWRLGSDGDVELSVDGGTTWLARPTGVGANLLAGAAPTASVCWWVGRVGTVVLTMDAETWLRVPIPEPVDLVSVQAADGERASVTAVDGRRFDTADGGATWTEVASP